MRIKVWGPEQGIAELLRKNGKRHEIITAEPDAGMMLQCDLFIDLHPDAFYSRTGLYEQFYPIPVLVNCVKDTLSRIYSEAFGNKERFLLFGFNGLPTFIDRPLAEVTMLHEGFYEPLNDIMGRLGWDFRVVEDETGMVTPRVIAMIINEAYYVLQEGTATREAVDLAMKLGTRYPFGPLEWCRKIGLSHIYELLERLYAATHEERFRPAPLLKREYRRQLLDG